MSHLTAAWASLQSEASAIRQHLLMRSQLFGEAPPGHRFSGRDDLIAHYGKPYRWAPDPEGLERGEVGLCFNNAIDLALNDDAATYVEGYALVHGVPLHHAWCTYDGRTAVDPTWERGTEYFGVPLSTSFVWARVAKRGYYGFFADAADRVEIAWYKNGLPAGALAARG